MILDPTSYALVNGSAELVEECGDPDRVKPELLESVLEICTPPGAGIAEVGSALRGLRATWSTTSPGRASRSASRKSS